VVNSVLKKSNDIYSIVTMSMQLHAATENLSELKQGLIKSAARVREAIQAVISAGIVSDVPLEQVPSNARSQQASPIRDEAGEDPYRFSYSELKRLEMLISKLKDNAPKQSK